MAAELVPHQPDREILFALDPEYCFRGNPEVITALPYKQQLLKEGKIEEASKIRIGLVCDGGGQAVCNETGAMEEFFERGYFDGVVDVVLGASGGAVVMANAVPGNRGGEKIFEENCKNDFFNPRNVIRGINGRRGMVNFSGFRTTLDTYSAKLEDLKAQKTDMYVLVVDGKTGEQKRLNIKDLPDQKTLNDVLLASCCMPVIGDLKSGEIDGVSHIDGGLPGIDVGKFVKDFNLTHVLVLRSHPIEDAFHNARMAHAFDAVSKIPLLRRNTSIREGLSSFKKGMDNLSRTLMLHWTNEEIAMGIFAPKEKIVDILCMDAKRIYTTIRKSQEGMKKLLEMYK